MGDLNLQHLVRKYTIIHKNKVSFTHAIDYGPSVFEFLQNIGYGTCICSNDETIHS